jgi:hypothetical protein
MRLVTYRDGETVSAGVLIDDEILPAAAPVAQAGLDIQSTSVRVLLASLTPNELTRLGKAASSADGRLSRDSVTLLPPVPDPQKIRSEISRASRCARESTASWFRRARLAR